MRILSRRLGRRVGGSTGTNFIAMCFHAARMIAAGEPGSLITLICDSGERYANIYYSDDWLKANGLDPSPFEPAIDDAARALTLRAAASLLGLKGSGQ